MEITELVKDYVATKLLSNFELDFLEAELWETFQHISDIHTLTIAPNKISRELALDDSSCWQLCCAAVLDLARPNVKNSNRVSKLKKLINKYNLGTN